jgi:hypothetical protein
VLLGAALAIIAAVVIWLSMSPAPAATGGQAQTIAAGDLRVTLQLDSAAMGERSIEVRIDDANGRPVAVDTVLLRFSMTDMDMGLPLLRLPWALALPARFIAYGLCPPQLRLAERQPS